jgi:hypothetical protein
MPDTPKRHAPRGPIKARDPLDVPDPLKPRCTARSKRSGVQCKRYPIPGGTVCIMHGGGAPQVQAKAMDRLLAIQFPAIARLAELVSQREYPSTAMAAVKDVLDRTMGKPVESLELTGAKGEPLTIRHELSE